MRRKRPACSSHRGPRPTRLLRSLAAALGKSSRLACGIGLLVAVGACGRGDVRLSDEVAAYAAATYAEAAETTLADLLEFQTVHRPGLENAENPEFQGLSAYLRHRAEELGLEFTDHGAVVVLALGEGPDRLGLITHGDVQPADASKWAADPFSLDTASEPGRLVGRGVEDDKGPIAAALYAMKAVRDREVPLARRIELIVSYTEESEWQPFRDFLAAHPPPAVNVALDSEYPVVSAEKGWGLIEISLPLATATASRGGPRLAAFSGGAFVSQIPGEARARIEEPTAELQAALETKARGVGHVRFDFESAPGELLIEARGHAAHSSKPWSGRNALTHLAALLGTVDWPDGPAPRMVRLINDLVGTGDYAERFGELAYNHPFMGSLTLSPTLLEEKDGALVASLNLRQPEGRSTEEIERLARAAVAEWQGRVGFEELEVDTLIYPPYSAVEAPQVPVLLEIFRRFTGQPDAEPLSIGGGTHARLVPNGVNFGPAMPGEPYTGHSEHEFMSREAFRRNLEMYAAMMVELAGSTG